MKAFNTLPFDPTTNEKATSYSFNHSCLNLPRDVTIHCDHVNRSYQINPAFIKRDRNKYYLSACTSILDVDPLMVSGWILFNLANGVEHITFYINGNWQLWRDTLYDYMKMGIVDLVPFSYAFHKSFCEQACALNSCNRRYRGLSKWVIFNDVDEFFITRNSSQRFIDIIRMYDHNHPDAAALVAYHVYHGCKSTNSWNSSLNIHRICPIRQKEVHRTSRMKVIAKPLQAPIINVHSISHAKSVPIDYEKDMILFHMKNSINYKQLKDDEIEEYQINPIVSSILDKGERWFLSHI